MDKRSKAAELNAEQYEPRFRKVAKVAFEEGAEWAQSHPGWIKVTERLPEAIKGYQCSEMVLVAWFGGDAASVAEYDYTRNKWLNRDDKIVAGVTHWMPIVLPD